MLSSIGCQNLTNVHTCFADASRSCLDHIITSIDLDKVTHGVLDYSPTNHLPVYAILKGITATPKKQNEKFYDIIWRFINDRKKEKFLNILANKLSNIDLTLHPEAILTARKTQYNANKTNKTQYAIDLCFPLKTKSNRAKKRSLTPWYNTEIFKGEKTQSKLFRCFIKTKNSGPSSI